MTQEALKLALEALGSTWTDVGTKQYEIEEEAIAAIKEALAQPEQEPVRIMGFNCKCGRRMEVSAEQGVIPAPERTWVGLTEDERDHLEGLHLYAVRGQVEAWIEGVDDFAKAIEAKLKEKNT